MFSIINKIILNALNKYNQSFKDGTFAPIVFERDFTEDSVSREHDMQKLTIDRSWLIPVKTGQAVSVGWTYTNNVPVGVTWHWTAGWTRDSADRTLGGKNPDRKGQASAHFCIGRSYTEGISQYVDIENRSWHAGTKQTIRWDGKEVVEAGTSYVDSRTCIGIETVNIGFARTGIKKEADWIRVFSPNGRTEMFVQPWTEEQVTMCIFIGKKIVEKYPNIGIKEHHGHMDVCPGYKEDCSLAFPFAKVLSGIYNEKVEDIWTPFLTIEGRQKVLQLLGYDIGKAGVDGDWGTKSSSALKAFQKETGLIQDGNWTTFVCWAIYEALKNKNIDIKNI